jgi:DNA polymerase
MTRELLRQYLSFYQDLGIRTLYRREPHVAPPSRSHEPAPLDLPLQPQAEPEAVQQFGEPPTGDTLARIREDIGDCTRCRLHQGRNKIVFGSGNEQAKLVFVGEGPGADEDAQGLPFVGRAGQLLTQMIEGTARKEGIPLVRKDVYICNVVKCRPPENRTPLPDEMETCGQFLFRQLTTIRPKAICVLGATAAKALLDRKEGVTRMRGQWFRWHDIPVMVTYHPSYLLRPYNQNAKREAWEDLKKVLHFVYD